MYNLESALSKLRELGITIEVIIPPLNQEYTKTDLANGLGTVIPPQEDGYLSSDTSSSFSAAIVVRQEQNSPNVKVVMVGSRNNGSPITQLGNQDSEDAPTYVKKVSFHKVWNGITTKPQDNNIRIITTRDNVFRMFQVAVITQITDDTRHFLVVQEMYRSQIFKDIDGYATMPDYSGFADWESLQNLVDGMVDQSTLEPEPAQDPKAEPIQAYKANEGQVIFFNPVTGTGKVATAEGAQHLHWSQINTPNRLAYFPNGQEVIYTAIGPGGTGTQLIGVRAK